MQSAYMQGDILSSQLQFYSSNGNCTKTCNIVNSVSLNQVKYSKQIIPFTHCLLGTIY